MKKIYQLPFTLVLFFSLAATAQVPLHSSYPSASAVVFLDFDGHYLNGSSWNTSGPLTLQQSNLNATQISEVFNRVAEDFRPFNINVTTDSTRYWAAPATSRMRVVLTISSSWYGSAGGVAYIGSFKWGDNTPCFVFTALLNYNVKNIAEAASHEVGHTFGLRHQAAYDATCAKTSEYHAGAGGGEIGWAPIMGVGYYRNFTVWHNGPNPFGCTSTQNDLEIITNSTNGFGYRPDDHKELAAQSTTLTIANNQFIATGVIERTEDRDMFKISLPASRRLQLNAIPYNIGSGNVGSNLDLQVQLMTSNQTVIGTYNPSTQLSSFADTILNAGTYYLLLDGKGNEFASEYGSLGSYSIQGTLSNVSALPLRKLELKGATEGAKHKLDWVIDADETVTKQELQVSNNGRDFVVVSQVNTTARQFNHTPVLTGTLQYRLLVSFDDGKQYYSNTVQLRNSAQQPKPRLLGNNITSMLTIVSPAAFEYQVVDATGRVVNRGKVNAGNTALNLSSLTGGMYLVQFANENEKYIERFLKQ